MAPKILLIEDDENIRTAIRLFLEQEAFEVSEAGDGETALARFADESFDVVLVDVMLPGIDGLEVVRRLRSQSAVPLVVLTARADTEDLVAGLEAGADDYVTKPVVAKELAARLRALLRRAGSATQSVSNSPDVLRFGELEIRPHAGSVTLKGREISLTRTEFRLLCELADHPNWVLSRAQLLERVWQYDYFGDTRLVDVHVRRLRAKIEQDAANPRLVVTVRGLGYKLQS